MCVGGTIGGDNLILNNIFDNYAIMTNFKKNKDFKSINKKNLHLFKK